MIAPAYRSQVDLLLHILPYVADEHAFALKGGTAINLFVRDMPRLSVDIDLVYLPFEERNRALRNISTALGRLKHALETRLPGLSVDMLRQRDGTEAKMSCRIQQAVVKVEVNTTMRGHVWPTRMMQLSQSAQAAFGKFATAQIVSHAELYGGKICAALDRQHPRDLFDIYHLFVHEGLTREVFLGFVVALLSHNRSIQDILQPTFQDRHHVLEIQFAGMTDFPFSYADFEVTRERLVSEIRAHITGKDSNFLMSFMQGDPDWALMPIDLLRDMPAVQWKLYNIRKLRDDNPAKHDQALAALQKLL